MKKQIFSFFVILFFCILAFSQDGLLIRNIKNGKAWMYEKNARITYIRFHEQEYTTGILNALLDTAVVLGSDTVPLKEIAGIRKKNSLHNIARIAGMPLMLIGSLFMGQGAANMYSDPNSSGGITIFLIGTGVFGLGYTPYALQLGDLTVGFKGEWTIEISRKAY